MKTLLPLWLRKIHRQTSCSPHLPGRQKFRICDHSILVSRPSSASRKQFLDCRHRSALCPQLKIEFSRIQTAGTLDGKSSRGQPPGWLLGKNWRSTSGAARLSRPFSLLPCSGAGPIDILNSGLIAKFVLLRVFYGSTPGASSHDFADTEHQCFLEHFPVYSRTQGGQAGHDLRQCPPRRAIALTHRPIVVLLNHHTE